MRLSTLHLLSLAALAGAMGLCASPARAEVTNQVPGTLFPQMPIELRTSSPNETGFTLGDLLDRKLWALARHPLQGHLLNQIGGDVHRAPRPGVQFELFTPSQAGATIHLRW